jgi:hypothetical protein
MKIKIIIGIVLPLLIIVLLAVLGSLEIGLTSSKEYIKNITRADVIAEGGLKLIS